MSELIEKGEFNEASRRAMRVVNVTNLIFPNEKMALNDGLSSEQHQKAFILALFDLLYGSEPLQSRFGGFASTLQDIGAAKWTTVTYFLFIVYPQRYVFLKPTVTQNAAGISAFEINYKPELNWRTYDSVLKFANYLREELSELKPRDMIDVQSFMWCIAPERVKLKSGVRT